MEENKQRTCIVISVYPLLAKLKGFTTIWEHIEFDQCKIKHHIADVLRKCPETLDDEEDEKYTMLVSFHDISAVAPGLIIPHGNPKNFSCSLAYQCMTKDEIWENFNNEYDIDEEIDHDDEGYDSNEESWKTYGILFHTLF
jgi:hypothetical protein